MTISSSAIVAKMIVDLKRSANADTEIILGLMMFQDVFVAVYLSIVSGLVLTGEASLSNTLNRLIYRTAHFSLKIYGLHIFSVLFISTAKDILETSQQASRQTAGPLRPHF